MNLKTLEQRAINAGFATNLHAHSLYIGEHDRGGIAWETARHHTVPGSGGRSRLAFLDADNVPAAMLALLD